MLAAFWQEIKLAAWQNNGYVTCYIVNLVNCELCCLVPLSFNFHEFVSFDEVNLLNFPFQDMSLFPPRCLCLWPGN